MYPIAELSNCFGNFTIFFQQAFMNTLRTRIPKDGGPGWARAVRRVRDRENRTHLGRECLEAVDEPEVSKRLL